MSNPASPSKSQAWRWPVIVVIFLAGHVTLMMVAVMFAVGDKNRAVVPDYYGQAIAWDDTQALRRSSEQLGWQAELTHATAADPRGQRDVTIQLTDEQGLPVPAESIQIHYVHPAHSSDRFTYELAATAPGQFAAKLPMRWTGRWQLTLRTEHQDQPFLAELSVWMREEGIEP